MKMQEFACGNSCPVSRKPISPVCFVVLSCFFGWERECGVRKAPFRDASSLLRGHGFRTTKYVSRGRERCRRAMAMQLGLRGRNAQQLVRRLRMGVDVDNVQKMRFKKLIGKSQGRVKELCGKVQWTWGGQGKRSQLPFGTKELKRAALLPCTTIYGADCDLPRKGPTTQGATQIPATTAFSGFLLGAPYMFCCWP